MRRPSWIWRPSCCFLENRYKIINDTKFGELTKSYHHHLDFGNLDLVPSTAKKNHLHLIHHYISYFYPTLTKIYFLSQLGIMHIANPPESAMVTISSLRETAPVSSRPRVIPHRPSPRWLDPRTCHFVIICQRSLASAPLTYSKNIRYTTSCFPISTKFHFPISTKFHFPISTVSNKSPPHEVHF